MSRFVAILAGAGVIMTLASPALADGPSILYAHDKAIWKAAADGKSEPTKVIELSVEAGEVTRIEPSPSSKFVLLEIGGTFAFAKLGADVTKPEKLDCARLAHLSPDGLCVGCLDGKGRLVIHALPTGKKRTLQRLKPKDFGFTSRTEMVITRKGAVERVSIVGGKYIEKAAAFAPRSMLVAPNGKRAVGTLAESTDKKTGDDKKDETVYGFKLDGKAARRQLSSAGVPTRWSRDSKWIVTQNGDRTCVIRAIGGQYKCWNGFTGLGLNLANDQFLLSQPSGKSHALFKVTMAGARPATPTLWKTTDSPAASWTY